MALSPIRTPEKPDILPPLRLRGEIVAVAVPVAVGACTGVGGQFAIGVLLGHLSGDALYVRGLLIPVGFLFVALQEGLEVVTQVGTARYRGRGEQDALGRLFTRLCGAGLVCFAAVACLVALAAPLLASMMHVPRGTAGDFVAVLRWTALINVLGVPVNVGAAMLRGGGRARQSAAVTLTSTVVQVGAVWLLGLREGLGIYSLPWAGAAALVCAAVLSGGFLLRSGLTRVAPPSDSPRGPGPRPAGPPVAVRSLLFGIGFPVAATYVMLSATNLVTEWILAPFGTATVAGYGSATLVQSIALVPAVALGTATAVTANQHWAAGDLRALPAALRAGVRIALGGYALIAVLGFLSAGPLARLMVSDPRVAAETAAFLRIVGPSFLSLGVMLFLLTFLEQVGAGLIAAGWNLCYFSLTLGLGGSLARSWGDPHTLYIVWAGGSVLGVLVMLPVTRHRIDRRPATGPEAP